MIPRADLVLLRCSGVHLARFLVPPLVVGLGCAPRPSPPNVLLVTLDTTRRDHCSAYGYRLETTPFLKELAASGRLRRALPKQLAASGRLFGSPASS